MIAMTVLLGTIIVLARFKTGFVWMQELVTYLHAIAFMTAAAFTLLHDCHVRVDLFYARAGPRAQAWINALGVALLLLPSCGTIFWFSIDYVLGSWEVYEGSPEAGGLPATFILKTFIWVYVFLVSLQGISLLGRSVATIMAPREGGGAR